MYNFAIIGAAGYVATRHMKAIKDTSNNLVAVLDPNDSIGIIDNYFPDADFFTEFERFDRHLEKLHRKGTPVDYISVCSPNYLHDAHIRFGLRIGANVICEKPMVLNPWNIEALLDIEKDYPGKVFNILQLRLHPSVLELKQKVENYAKDQFFNIDLKYITSRGRWYQYSWKGAIDKSGGIATNIGIHFFDMLIWIFGSVKKVTVLEHNEQKAEGILELDRARINWFLSIDTDDLPKNVREKGDRIYRFLSIGDEQFEFNRGFNELHTTSYQKIFEGQGYGIDTVKPAIDLVYEIRKYFKSKT